MKSRGIGARVQVPGAGFSGCLCPVGCRAAWDCLAASTTAPSFLPDSLRGYLATRSPLSMYSSADTAGAPKLSEQATPSATVPTPPPPIPRRRGTTSALPHIVRVLSPSPSFDLPPLRRQTRRPTPIMVPEHVRILIVWHVVHHAMPCPEAARLFGCDASSVCRIKAT